jgi:phosphate-selective porin
MRSAQPLTEMSTRNNFTFPEGAITQTAIGNVATFLWQAGAFWYPQPRLKVALEKAVIKSRLSIVSTQRTEKTKKKM